MARTVDQGQVAFDVLGTGPTILFLHAFPLSSAMWTAQAQGLSSQFQVVRMDARGFGASLAPEGPLSMSRIAGDALAVLDDLGVERAIVCGCSMGGYAAFALARHAPQRLQALILVDTKASPDTDEARAGRVALAEKVIHQGAAAVAEANLPKLLGATTHRERSQVVAQVRAWTLEASPAALASALLGLGARADSRPILATIAVPTLIVRGDEDAIITADDARELNEGIRGSRLVSLPRVGHLPSLEDGAAFDDAVSPFLRELPR